MPRGRRVKGRDESFYHITTRCVDKVIRFTDEENERNTYLLRQVEEFSCVQIIAFCFMGNHFHILLRVPVRQEVSEKDLYDKINILYGPKVCAKLKRRWTRFREHGYEDVVLEEQDRFRKRMYDMGEFMKTLKQRLTMSFNKRHNRVGTLWEERYKSILLEATPRVLTAVAAYIDLNPVRANMIEEPVDPAKYAFSSYGEACRGSLSAQQGLCRIYQEGDSLPTWEKVYEVYQKLLNRKAGIPEDKVPKTKEEFVNALKKAGKRTLTTLLRHKNLFFSQGIALGGAAFIEVIEELFPKPRRQTPPIKQ